MWENISYYAHTQFGGGSAIYPSTARIIFKSTDSNAKAPLNFSFSSCALAGAICTPKQRIQRCELEDRRSF